MTLPTLEYTSSMLESEDNFLHDFTRDLKDAEGDSVLLVQVPTPEALDAFLADIGSMFCNNSTEISESRLSVAGRALDGEIHDVADEIMDCHSFPVTFACWIDNDERISICDVNRMLDYDEAVRA